MNLTHTISIETVLQRKSDTVAALIQIKTKQTNKKYKI